MIFTSASVVCSYGRTMSIEKGNHRSVVGDMRPLFIAPVTALCENHVCTELPGTIMFKPGRKVRVVPAAYVGTYPVATEQSQRNAQLTINAAAAHSLLGSYFSEAAAEFTGRVHGSTRNQTSVQSLWRPSAFSQVFDPNTPDLAGVGGASTVCPPRPPRCLCPVRSTRRPWRDWGPTIWRTHGTATMIRPVPSNCPPAPCLAVLAA